MFQLDASNSFPVQNEAEFTFRLCARIVLPISRNVPRKQKARMRFSGENAIPLARAAIPSKLMPAAAHLRLDHSVETAGCRLLCHYDLLLSEIMLLREPRRSGSIADYGACRSGNSSDPASPCSYRLISHALRPSVRNRRLAAGRPSY